MLERDVGVTAGRLELLARCEYRLVACLDPGPERARVYERGDHAQQRLGAKFDIRNGKALTMPATQPTVAHEVQVVGDEVLVKLTS